MNYLNRDDERPISAAQFALYAFFRIFGRMDFRKKTEPEQFLKKLRNHPTSPFSVDTEDRYSYTSPHKKGSPYQTNLEFHLLMRTLEK